MDDRIKTRGIVLRSVNTGDYDRMLTVLTAENGQISVSAKGVRSMRSRNSAGTSFLCYGEFILKRGAQIHSLRENRLIEGFYGIRESVEALACANYFAALTAMCTQSGLFAENELKLLLNALYFLAQCPGRTGILKCVFELRMMALCGFAPEIGDCACGNKGEFFDFDQDSAVCPLHKGSRYVALDAPCARLMREILTSSLKNALCVSATLAEIEALTPTVERFLSEYLGKLPKALDYWHTLH